MVWDERSVRFGTNRELGRDLLSSIMTLPWCQKALLPWSQIALRRARVDTAQSGASTFSSEREWLLVLSGRQVQAMPSATNKTEGPVRESPSRVQRNRILSTAMSPSPIIRPTGLN